MWVVGDFMIINASLHDVEWY